MSEWFATKRGKRRPTPHTWRDIVSPFGFTNGNLFNIVECFAWSRSGVPVEDSLEWRRSYTDSAAWAGLLHTSGLTLERMPRFCLIWAQRLLDGKPGLSEGGYIDTQQKLPRKRPVSGKTLGQWVRLGLPPNRLMAALAVGLTYTETIQLDDDSWPGIETLAALQGGLGSA